MTAIKSTTCCGLVEFENISHSRNPEEILRSVGRDFNLKSSMFSTWRAPLAIFTGVTKRVVPDHASGRTDNYGQEFADYIIKNGLGSVVESHEVRNHWNLIKVWVWEIDNNALECWFDEREVKE